MAAICGHGRVLRRTIAGCAAHKEYNMSAALCMCVRACVCANVGNKLIQLKDILPETQSNIHFMSVVAFVSVAALFCFVCVHARIGKYIGI